MKARADRASRGGTSSRHRARKWLPAALVRSVRRLALVILITAQAGCATLATTSAAARGATELALRLDSILSDTAFAHAHVGALVVSLRTGDTIYSRNAGRVFLPASNQKLLTGAAALEALGPAHRYATTVSASGQVRDGVLRGDLIVRGTGDPTFSARFNPVEARSAFIAWADSLRARGITRVQGGIVGVDSAFPGPTLGSGWAWDDLPYGFAAEYGALQFNEGVVRLQIVPAQTVGAPPVVVLDPPTQHVRIYNLATTGAPGTPLELTVRRDELGPGVTVEGTIPLDTIVARTVAVRDPTAYFLSVVREALREAGIMVEGQALPADEWPLDRTGVVEMLLFTHRSPPLAEVLPAMMKPSQNQIAETLLLTIGRELRGEASAAAGATVVDSLLRAWGLPADELRMADGSGMSRYNLASPRLFVGLLGHMRRSASRDLWRASLPIAGVDGTLESRMREPPLRENVLAKTGTLTGVRALSGYLTTSSGDELAFSFLVDHHLRTAAAADRMVEAALLAIVEAG